MQEVYENPTDIELKQGSSFLKTLLFYNGVVIRPIPEEGKVNKDFVTHPNVTLFPSPFPKKCFQEGQLLQKDFNELFSKVAHDYNFLKNSLKDVIEADEFTRKLWNIYEQVRLLSTTQKVSLGMFRSDYMLHSKDGNTELKQVEFNTIASSFGGLSSKISDCHRFMLINFGYNGLIKNVPENLSINTLCLGLYNAFKYYDTPGAIVLFLVTDDETNEFDQRILEFGLMELDNNIKIIRPTFNDLVTKGNLMEDGRYYYKEKEVAVIYMRNGYSPDQYNNEAWKARLDFEKSKAIKCPSIHFQLAGTKAVQQKLCEENILENFLTDKTAVQRIRNTFVALYVLNDETINMVLKCPKNFVLKPQREGGGNNYYGDDISRVLQNMKIEDRKAFILMERIFPPSVKNCQVKPNLNLEWKDMISELGIYGCVLSNANCTLFSNNGGHLLRTKLENVDEGGVSTGFSAIDSPLLT